MHNVCLKKVVRTEIRKDLIPSNMKVSAQLYNLEFGEVLNQKENYVRLLSQKIKTNKLWFLICQMSLMMKH